ncbi:MAG: PaaI family thioesterase [Pseudomonadales bacterium]|nr:PaaI family thioesterase [Pseudomonadales bacterium]MDP6469478.1 PaaI family thioesterase [Pseudomonadales bacterium]MDP6827320.1 PaaI family thioesterase [Pseudomonadales bacterium]MDP6971143.1 PaaI family thioesterase [Pseudomonadales bacterium]
MTDVGQWVERSGYSKHLGAHIEELSEEGARIALPFREGNSNPGGALHGGVYASLSVIAAQATARAVLGAEAGPFHTVGFQINYLAAAINEGVSVQSRLLRRGKELCFFEATVTSESGRDVSHSTLMIRGRQGSTANDGPLAIMQVGGDDPGKMGPAVTSAVPFIHERGIEIQHMAGGEARLFMPWQDSHEDSESGGTHEGAALALLDTAGAMAAWAVTGPGPFKASTPSMQAQVLAALPKGDLVAHARVSYRDNEIFYSDVEVMGIDDERLRARGTIVYRIVT